MKKLPQIIIVFLLILLLGFIGMKASAQTTGTFSEISTSADDFLRPDAGCNEWSYDQWVCNIPTAGVNTISPARYWRFTGLDFQPFNGSPGVYDWTVFDSKVQQSINKRQKFSFGTMVECTACDANLKGSVGGSLSFYPLWLHNQMQAESVKDYVNGDWIPNTNSPSYLNYIKARNQAINDHIMNTTFMGVRYRDVIGQIDIRDYGNFGEWTNNPIGGPPAGTNPTIASLDSIISYHVHVFDNFQCVNMIAAFDGQYQLNNTYVPAAVGYYALTVRNSKGWPLGWRRDNWGQTDSYITNWTINNATVFNGIRFGDTISRRYQTAPVVGEPQDGGSAGNFPNLSAQVIAAGANSVGNGNFNNGTNATIQANFRAASKLMGYRIVPTAWSMTTSIATGSTYNLSMSWKNVNGIPAYDDWRVVYEWRNSSNTVLQRDTAAFRLRLFFATTATAQSQNFILNTVPAGSGYSLYMRVVDPTGYMKPMPLFITGVLSDGSYLVRSGITVTGSGPVANAGPNQSIATTSATLTSSASVGATSQAWTQLSGPNTASITTPSAVSTTVTGLVTGTYVFQVAINGATSGQQVSTVTITVNAGGVQANAGNNQTITLPANSALLTGAGSTGATTYAWTQVSGPNTAVIGTPSGTTTPITGLIVGTYVFRLSINAGASIANVSVTVLPAASGVANAGGDQTIVVTTPSITLNGSGSTGTITSYAWSEVSGPTSAPISTPNAASTSAGPFAPGVYKFRLLVNGLSSDTVQLTVNSVIPPPPPPPPLPPPAGTNIFTTQTPSGGTLNDGSPITLGVKFQSKVNGYITGIRFYKTVGNNGTHIGLLYSRAGTELARATFVNETASGWQWASFATAVPIDSNTTYVFAYFSPNGTYVATNEYFTTSVINTPIIGLAKGVDGNNGIYIYNGTAAFPTSYYSDHKPNYWVDGYYTANNPGQIPIHENHRIYFKQKP